MNWHEREKLDLRVATAAQTGSACDVRSGLRGLGLRELTCQGYGVVHELDVNLESIIRARGYARLAEVGEGVKRVVACGCSGACALGVIGQVPGPGRCAPTTGGSACDSWRMVLTWRLGLRFSRQPWAAREPTAPRLRRLRIRRHLPGLDQGSRSPRSPRSPRSRPRIGGSCPLRRNHG